MGGKVIQAYYQFPRPLIAPPGAPRPAAPARGPAPVAQAKGPRDSFQVDPGRLGLAAGGGRPLPDAVRGRMEAAFGSDFSAVRVYVGPQPARIGAVAFTVGTDIYFAPGRFDPQTTPGLAVLGHELAHVVQQRAGRVANPYGSGVAVVQDRLLEAEADRLGQRAALHRAPAPMKPAISQPVAPLQGHLLQPKLRKGKDPLKNLSKPGSRGLLYGTSTTRKETSKRLMTQDVQLGLNVRRSIDAYNLDIGLNDVMDKAGDPTGIFRVRDALMEHDVVGQWRTHFPLAEVGMEADPDLTDWIAMLEKNLYWISLYDLGLPQKSRKKKDYRGAKQRRIAKLDSKDRFEKNFTDENQWSNTNITRTSLLEWLAADKTLIEAQTEAALMSNEDKYDLAKWVRTAFWRRTSKLGIDFTTGRGHIIHFNTAADHKWNPSKGGTPKMRKGDLKKIHGTYGRMITTSEYRHVTKRIREGDIPKTLVNFYDEW